MGVVDAAFRTAVEKALEPLCELMAQRAERVGRREYETTGGRVIEEWQIVGCTLHITRTVIPLRSIQNVTVSVRFDEPREADRQG